jgi:hypothetical protein
VGVHLAMYADAVTSTCYGSRLAIAPHIAVVSVGDRVLLSVMLCMKSVVRGVHVSGCGQSAQHLGMESRQQSRRGRLDCCQRSAVMSVSGCMNVQSCNIGNSSAFQVG